MPTESERISPSILDAIVEPYIEPTFPELSEQGDTSEFDPYVVILYNDDVHSFDQVIAQTQKATGYDILRCEQIVVEAHTRGRAIAYTGSSEECERVAAILRQIRLQVETDKF